MKDFARDALAQLRYRGIYFEVAHDAGGAQHRADASRHVLAATEHKEGRTLLRVLNWELLVR